MARDPDGIIQIKYANSGDVGLGGLDLNKLWPLAYSTPGGPFPQRIQFNQLWRFISALAVEINQGGPYLAYTNLIDYKIGAVVSGSDSRLYEAVVINGPSSSIVDPVGDITGVWRLGGAKNFRSVTTSGPLLITDIVFVDATAGDIVLTAPSAAAMVVNGTTTEITIKRTDTSSNKVTISGITGEDGGEVNLTGTGKIPISIASDGINIYITGRP